MLNYCLECLDKNSNLALYDSETFGKYLHFIRSVPKLSDELKTNLQTLLGQIRPDNVIEFWPMLLQPENMVFYGSVIHKQLLTDLDPRLHNPKFNAMLTTLQRHPVMKHP